MKRMQAMIQITRAVRPSASPGVVATTELNMFTRTRRVVISRAHLTTSESSLKLHGLTKHIANNDRWKSSSYLAGYAVGGIKKLVHEIITKIPVWRT